MGRLLLPFQGAICVYKNLLMKYVGFIRLQIALDKWIFYSPGIIMNSPRHSEFAVLLYPPVVESLLVLVHTFQTQLAAILSLDKNAVLQKSLSLSQQTLSTTITMKQGNANYPKS